jgi:uncharacterized protein (DUF488 family)
MPKQIKFPSKIWTIGHSTHPINLFIEMLKSFNIELLADVRSLPGSKRYPQFNKEELARTLKENNIEYVHMPELGGRRKVNKDSHNAAWRNKAFQGYADYMETGEFIDGIKKLCGLAINKRTAYMC